MTSPDDLLCSRLQLSLGDGYTLDREIGGGGMSRVFLAHEGPAECAGFKRTGDSLPSHSAFDYRSNRARASVAPTRAHGSVVV